MNHTCDDCEQVFDMTTNPDVCPMCGEGFYVDTEA